MSGLEVALDAVVLTGILCLVAGLIGGWVIAAHQERKYVEDLERRLELLRRLVRIRNDRLVTPQEWLRVLEEHVPAHVTLEEMLRELQVAAERRRVAN